MMHYSKMFLSLTATKYTPVVAPKIEENLTESMPYGERAFVAFWRYCTIEK